MRIAITHPAATPLTYNMVAGLQARGHDVTFYTGFYYKPSLERTLTKLPQNIRTRLERECRRRFHPGINPASVHLINGFGEFTRVVARKGPFPKFAANRLWNMHCERFDRLAAREIKRDRPDIVIGHDDSCLHTHAAAQKVGSTSVLNQVIGHTFSANRLLSEESKLHPEFAEDLFVTDASGVTARKQREPLQADIVLSPSQYVSATLMELGVAQGRIINLPYGVETSRFTPRNNPSRPFRVLFVGRIEQRKGIKYLLEAFKRLNLRDAELILVGSPGSNDGLAPYRDIFTHVQNVPYAEVHRYFAQASIFVYPSLHEGSALAIFEALASGLPVITTPNAGSVVRDGTDGYIVPIRDTQALMDRIQRLYGDDSLRQTMAMNARERAEAFSWARYGDELEAVLDKLVRSAAYMRAQIPVSLARPAHSLKSIGTVIERPF